MIGFLNLYARQEGYYAAIHAQRMQAFADQVSVAFTNARLFDDVQRHLERLESLHTIDRAISSSFDLRVTLEVVLDQVTRQLGVDAAAVSLLNAHSQTLLYAATRGIRTGSLQHTQWYLGEGYAGRAALERRTVGVGQVDREIRDAVIAPALRSEKFATYLATPLIAKGQVKGVLEVFHRAPLDPDATWVEFLETLAGQTAIAVDNADLLSDLQRSHAELTLAYDATLAGWSRALELRDRETDGHAQRVTALTERLARAMGVPESEIVHIRRGALLHDIGKMGVPDSILLKPGALTEGEREIMKRLRRTPVTLSCRSRICAPRSISRMPITNGGTVRAIRAGLKANKFPWPRASLRSSTCGTHSPRTGRIARPGLKSGSWTIFAAAAGRISIPKWSTRSLRCRAVSSRLSRESPRQSSVVSFQ